MKTTLNKIKEHDPCEQGWENLLNALGKTTADDEPIELSFILESNGYIDALWALRAVEGYDREIRLFAVWCARQVQHLMTDERSIKALDVAERFANGEATSEELTSASDDAWAAARDSAGAAARAASDAGDAGAAAAAAARYAARAAWAARAAARAARDAARAAAWAAAGAASDAAAGARAAGAMDATRAARDAQVVEFKKLIAL